MDVIISGIDGEDHENVMDSIDNSKVVNPQWTKFEIGIGRQENKFQVILNQIIRNMESINLYK